MKLGYYVWIMAGTSEAYIQPAPYCTTETVKSDLNRLMLLVDDTKSQSQVRLMHGIALWRHTARPPLPTVDQTVDQITPVAGTIMRQ